MKPKPATRDPPRSQPTVAVNACHRCGKTGHSPQRCYYRHIKNPECRGCGRMSQACKARRKRPARRVSADRHNGQALDQLDDLNEASPMSTHWKTTKSTTWTSPHFRDSNEHRQTSEGCYHCQRPIDYNGPQHRINRVHRTCLYLQGRLQRPRAAAGEDSSAHLLGTMTTHPR